MIPMIMKINVKPEGKRGVNLWFPVILVWILLILLIFLLAPIVLLAALITWNRGYGKIMLLIYPMLLYLLFLMSGLKVDIQSRELKLFFNFI